MLAHRARMLRDALAAGFVGYLAVVVFFGTWNVAAGRSPFHTAALLGEALIGGLRDPAALAMDPGAILAVNGVHLLGFIAFGFFAAWLVYEVELHPDFWYLAFFFFLAATVASYAVVLAVTLLVGTVISPWLVLGSSLVGALAMAGFLAGSHRALFRAIQGMSGHEGERVG